MSERRQVISIEEAGRRLGISRAQAYIAAREGLIPSLLVGKRKRVVPLRKFRQMLGEVSEL